MSEAECRLILSAITTEVARLADKSKRVDPMAGFNEKLEAYERLYVKVTDMMTDTYPKPPGA